MTAILRPEQPRSPLIAVVAVSGDIVSARLPERHEAFREAMHLAGMAWDGRQWERRIVPEWHGAAEDRAAEVACRILAAGFLVEVPDALAARAAAGDYAPEQTRWVRALPGGRFVFRWRRDAEDYYCQAMRVPGARYGAGEITAPADAWREILDFVEANSFALSAKALDLIATARARYESAVLATPPRRPAPAPAQPAAPGIHPDLRDNDANDD